MGRKREVWLIFNLIIKQKENSIMRNFIFECNTKPREIKIQRCTKAGYWETISVISKTGRKDMGKRLDSREIVDYFNFAINAHYNDVLRVVNEYDKVLVSTGSIGFLSNLHHSRLLTMKLEDGSIEYISTTGNTNHRPISYFHKTVKARGGIKSFVKRVNSPNVKDTEYDFTEKGRLYFKDGSSVLVDFFD